MEIGNVHAGLQGGPHHPHDDLRGLEMLWIAAGRLDVVALIEFRGFNPNPPSFWPPTC